MIGKHVPNPAPALDPTGSKNPGVLTRAAVVPAARTPHLPSELHQGNIQGRLHKTLFAGAEQRLCDKNVVRSPIVAREHDRFLLRVCLFFQGFYERLYHDGLHHTAPIAKHLSSKGVHNSVGRRPCHSAMNRRFTHPVAPIVH